MKQLYYAIQTILRGRGSNVMKVLSLTLGLTIGILLFAQVAFELSYERCYPDSEQLAIVRAQYTTNNIRDERYNNTVEGTVASAIMDNLSEDVKCATVYAGFLLDDLYKDDAKLDPQMLYVDTLFFETLGIPVLQGNPREGLQMENCAFISRAYAKKIFGDENPIGKELLRRKTTAVVIKGVFEEIPENSVIQADIVISMRTLDYMMGRPKWGQNQIYYNVVRLKDAGKFDRFNKQLQPMVEKYMSFNPEKNGYYVEYSALKLHDLHTSNPDFKKRLFILAALGFSILFVAIMNYVLVAIATMSRRAKMVGVHKCNGASSGKILGMFLIETGIIVLIALLLTAFIMLNSSSLIEDLLSTRLDSLFTWQTMWVPLLCIAIVFLVGGFLPGRIYAIIPATQAFRRYTDGKKGWKRSLLFTQFVGVSFILGLLLVTLLQYHRLMTQPLGFNSDGLVVSTILNDQREHVMDDIRRQPMVEDVSAATANLLGGQYYGNYIYSESGQALFHTQFLPCHENFAQLIGLELVEGRWPRTNNEIVVNEEFVKQWKRPDSPLGKRPKKDWGEIVGVFKDYRNLGLGHPQACITLVADKNQPYVVHVRLKAPFDENLIRLQEYLRETFPTVGIDFHSVNEIRKGMNESTYRFRNSVLVTSIFILLIVVMGLVGYVNDETQRRSKEIAIRKVNGAEVTNVLRLLTHDILYVSVPAILIGTAISYYAGKLWLEQFLEQIYLNPLLFVGMALAVMIIIVVCVVARAWHIANENPVLSIKSE
ncbi:FtsX-like permease family protein [Phocaeicola sp.]